MKLENRQIHDSDVWSKTGGIPSCDAGLGGRLFWSLRELFGIIKQKIR